MGMSGLWGVGTRGSPGTGPGAVFFRGFGLPTPPTSLSGIVCKPDAFGSKFGFLRKKRFFHPFLTSYGEWVANQLCSLKEQFLVTNQRLYSKSLSLSVRP